jgi:hypothetical protein
MDRRQREDIVCLQVGMKNEVESKDMTHWEKQRNKIFNVEDEDKI